MLYYLSTPYSGNWFRRQLNIYRAWRLTAKLWDQGYITITPVLNTANFEHLIKWMTHKHYVQYDLHILDKCDAIIMAPGWKKSKGCLRELEYANEHFKDIIYLDDPYGRF